MASEADKPTEYERFEQLTKRLLRVPKKGIDQKEKERPRRQRKPKEPDSK